MRDQNSLPFTRFKGLWSRGDDDTCPPDHLMDAENLKLDKIGLETREGTTVSTTRAGRILRMRLYKPLTGTPSIILLQDNGVNATLFDLGFSSVTPISGGGGINATDFDLANIYGRAYMTFHNRTLASATGNLMVYDGSGAVIRNAGMAAPTSVLVETATGAGNIEVGTLLLTYCYESVSGAISAPYTTTVIQHTFAAGSNSITITVPNGPAGTAAKRILACKTIPAGLYNGDYRTQEFFFVPGNGRIPNNTTTSVVLSFFNAELISTADPIFDILATIVSGLFVTTYGTRLVVAGDAANPSIVRVSEIGYPEAFSSTSGFLTVDPSEQGGIKAGFEFQGAFVITKTKKSYVTSDNGDEASTWDVTTLDGSVGCEFNGVSVITDGPGAWKNIALVADRAGLMVFTGVYGEVPLTDKVKAIWEGIDKAVFDQIQVVVDPQIKRIYCLIPYGVDNSLAYPNTLLVGSYLNGLDPENIEWCPWAFYPVEWGTKSDINCIMMDYSSTTSKPTLKLGMNTDLAVFDSTVHNDLSSRQSIPCIARTAYVNFDDEDSLCTFLALRARFKGFGRVFITLNTIDDVVTKDYLRYIDINTGPGHPYDKLLNYMASKVSITLHMNTQLTTPFNDFYFQLSKLTLFGKATWASAPSLMNMRS